MSGPHPEAIGSLGVDAAKWLGNFAGIDLRWWQRLALARMLEYDEDGQLVWLDVLLSTARQVGKSWLVRALALWRVHQAGRFGEEQLVLHTGKDLAVCRELHRRGRLWARERTALGYTVRDTNGTEEMGTPDGSRWIVRGSRSVYGYPATLALADEAWAMLPSMVEDGLEPTMAERRSPQLVLLSTAHRFATTLYPSRRLEALESWERPGDTLMLEWSAPRHAEIGDREAWRQASPHWSPGRARLLETRLRRADAGMAEGADDTDPVEAFRAQYLNIWPVRMLTGGRDEPLVDQELWRGCADVAASVPESGPVAASVEDWFGLGAAAACAAITPDDRVLVWGSTFETRAEATSWAVAELDTRRRADGLPGADSTLCVGASLNAPDVAAVLERPVLACSAVHTRTALPLVRSLVHHGRLVHGGARELSGQVTACRVVSRDGGLAVAHRGVRSDLVRAMAWAVQQVVRPAPMVPDFFVY